MAWAPMIEHGTTVETPHGQGTVERVSEINQTAQVKVGGQLFEVPMEDIGKKQEFKVGDWVTVPEYSDGTEVREITKATDEGYMTASVDTETGKFITQYTTHRKAEQLRMANVQRQDIEKKEGEEAPVKTQPKTPNTTKVGDRVQTKDGTMKGEVKEVTQRTVKVDFDNGVKQSFEKKRIDKYLDEEQPSPETPETKETPKETPVPQETTTQTGDGLHELFKLKEYMEKKVETEVEAELKDIKELAKKNQKLEVRVGEKVNVIEGLKHKQLEQLITYCALRLNPLLVGMAGTGKTHAGEQTSKALGLPFFSMSVGAQTSKSDIIGYMDASGRYVKTHFREAYENGGVFLMDEIDAGNANVLIQVNAALSNGLCAFPDKMVTRHEDFVFIASANTYGNGANRQYVGRNQLDAATLDRFAVIDWLIDDELESNLAFGLNGKAWYMAVRAVRDYIAEKNIRALASPRATQKGSKLLDVGQDVNEVINATLLGSVPEDKKADVTQVAVTIFNKFASKVPGVLPKEVNAEVADLITPF